MGAAEMLRVMFGCWFLGMLCGLVLSAVSRAIKRALHPTLPLSE